VTHAEETVRSGDGHGCDKEQKGNGMLGITCRTVIQKKEKRKRREGN
jgi:hypothetical protein